MKNETNFKWTIINLSTYKLNKDQINLLKLGLKFCPTPKSNIEELKKDLKEFERKFRLIEKFRNQKDTDDSLVKNKTKFFPDKNNNSEQNIFFEKLWSISLKEKKTTVNNFSQNQKQALKIYRKMKTIIKEADKGNTVVILDKKYYKTKLPEIL